MKQVGQTAVGTAPSVTTEASASETLVHTLSAEFLLVPVDEQLLVVPIRKGTNQRLEAELRRQIQRELASRQELSGQSLANAAEALHADGLKIRYSGQFKDLEHCVAELRSLVVQIEGELRVHSVAPMLAGSASHGFTLSAHWAKVETLAEIVASPRGADTEKIGVRTKLRAVESTTGFDTLTAKIESIRQRIADKCENLVGAKGDCLRYLLLSADEKTDARWEEEVLQLTAEGKTADTLSRLDQFFDRKAAKGTERMRLSDSFVCSVFPQLLRDAQSLELGVCRRLWEEATKRWHDAKCWPKAAVNLREPLESIVSGSAFQNLTCKQLLGDATRALWQLGPIVTVDIFLKLLSRPLETKKNPYREAMVALWDRGRIEEVEPEFRKHLGHIDQTVRCYAAAGLALRVGDTKPLVSIVDEGWKEKSLEELLGIVGEIGLAASDLVPILLEIGRKDEALSETQTFDRVLARIGDKSRVIARIDALSNDDPRQVEKAVVWLGNVGPAALEALPQLLRISLRYPSLRRSIAESASRIAPNCSEIIEDLEDCVVEREWTDKFQDKSQFNEWRAERLGNRLVIIQKNDTISGDTTSNLMRPQEKKPATTDPIDPTLLRLAEQEFARAKTLADPPTDSIGSASSLTETICPEVETTSSSKLSESGQAHLATANSVREHYLVLFQKYLDSIAGKRVEDYERSKQVVHDLKRFAKYANIQLLYNGSIIRFRTLLPTRSTKACYQVLLPGAKQQPLYTGAFIPHLIAEQKKLL